MLEPVRVNTKISARSNEWLDKKSSEMALSKSALINIAIESFIEKTEIVHGLPKIMKQLEEQGIRLDL